MNVVAEFEKVSINEFRKLENQIVWLSEEIGNINHVNYDHIKLPTRSTLGSAGYDFYMPFNWNLTPGESVLVPTYIKCRIDPGWVLMLFPRSSLGFKYQIMLANTIGVVDSDYYGNENNEGHILIKLVNGGEKTVQFSTNDKFCQGIFLPYGITTDDHQTDKKIRSGGFGSTGN